MTQQEMVDLAHRISALDKNVSLEDFMGALGMVVFHCFTQFEHADRLMALTAWHGALFNQISNDERKRKAN